MIRCVRTRINLSDDLCREAKQAALGSSRTFTALVKDALRAALSARADRVAFPERVVRPAPSALLDATT